MPSLFYCLCLPSCSLRYNSPLWTLLAPGCIPPSPVESLYAELGLSFLSTLCPSLTDVMLISTNFPTIPPSHLSLPTHFSICMYALLSHSFRLHRPFPFPLYSFSPVFPDPPKPDIPLLSFSLIFLIIFPPTAPVFHDFAVVFPSHTFNFPLPLEPSGLMTELYMLFFALKRMSSLPSSSFTIFMESRHSPSFIQSMHLANPLGCKIQDWLFYLST